MKFKYLPIYQSPHSGSSIISFKNNSNSDIDVREGKVFCEKTGIEYSIIDGQLHIYNKEHIPLILQKDIQVFAQAHINMENQKNAGVIDSPNFLIREKIYEKAKITSTPYSSISIDLNVGCILCGMRTTSGVASGTYIVVVNNSAGKKVGAKKIVIRRLP